MSETPSEYTAQEAEAEGVRPLRDGEEKAWRMALDKVIWTWKVSYPALFMQRVVATLDAARAELERKEAEAAVLREALLFVQPYMEEAHFNRVDAREIIWAQARKALNTTEAGADLLERVRQLEGVAGAAAEVIAWKYPTDKQLGTLPRWYACLDKLETALAALDQQHQGTGAAGEGE